MINNKYYKKYIKYKNKYIKIIGGAFDNKHEFDNSELFNLINDISETTNLTNKFTINVDQDLYQIYYNSINIHDNFKTIIIDKMKDLHEIDIDDDTIFVKKYTLICKQNMSNTDKICLINNDILDDFFKNDATSNILKKILFNINNMIILNKRNDISIKGLALLINFLKKKNTKIIYNNIYKVWITDKEFITDKFTLLNIQSDDKIDNIFNISIRLNFDNTKLFEVYINNSDVPLLVTEINELIFNKRSGWYKIITKIITTFVNNECIFYESRYTILNYHPIIFDLEPEVTLNNIISVITDFIYPIGIRKPLAHIQVIKQLDDNLDPQLGIDMNGLTKQFYNTLMKKLFDGTEYRILQYTGVNPIYPLCEKLDDPFTITCLENIGILLEYIYYTPKLHGLTHVIPNNYFLLFNKNYNSMHKYHNLRINEYLRIVCLSHYKSSVNFLIRNNKFIKSVGLITMTEIFKYSNVSGNYTLENFIKHMEALKKIEMDKTLIQDNTIEYIYANIKIFRSDNINLNIKDIFTILDNNIIENFNGNTLPYNLSTFIKHLQALEDFFIRDQKYNLYIDTVSIIYNGFGKSNYSTQYPINSIYNERGNIRINEIKFKDVIDLAVTIQGIDFNAIDFTNRIKQISTHPVVLEKIIWLKEIITDFIDNPTDNNIKWIKDFLFYATGKDALSNKSEIKINETNYIYCQAHTCFDTIDFPITHTIFPHKEHEDIKNKTNKDLFYDNLTFAMTYAKNDFTIA